MNAIVRPPNFQSDPWPLFSRICWAQHALRPYRSEYAIYWEDPDTPDAPLKVSSIAPEWMAMALNGYCLPPVRAYAELKYGCFDGNEPMPWKIYDDEYDAKRHCEDHADNTYRIVNGHVIHASVIPPLTEKEAFQYIIQKDIPKRVWQRSGANRSYLKIAPHKLVEHLDPSTYDSWRLGREV